MKVAIIPARGGSKRIPRKNIRDFCGKPMIAYSIEAAILSGCFDKVLVSTDDPEIAAVSKQYGAEVPFIRPSEIANDFATTTEVVRHALIWCEAQSWGVEIACCIYATAPFIDKADLLLGYDALIKQDVAYVFSASSYPFPIQRALALDADGRVSMIQPEYLKTRSQDLKECYHDAGQFYWGRKAAFLNDEPIFSDHSRMILIPRDRVQDIDTQEDWNFAELLFRATK
jgi:pseudaminic acid cytidylyltransferase